MVTAHLSPSERDAQWYVLHASEEHEKPVAWHYHASSETDAIAYAGNSLAARWPSRDDEITLHVHTKSAS